MTLQQMEYIVAVYRLRHFAKAAEQCGVTQPTLSSMIQKLEDELGLRIFDRTAQPVAPTPAGRLVVEQAWRVLVRANKIKDIVAEAKRSVRGAFKVGILPTIAPYLLPRFFPRLLAGSQAVLPEAEEFDVEISMNDIRKDIFCASGPGGQSVNTTYSAIRLTHIPTGIVVQCQDQKSQLKNFDKAFEELRTRVFNLEYSKYLDEIASKRKTMVSTGDRSAKIRTYNYPQGRITDHRINYTIYNLAAFMDGDIQDVIDHLIVAENAERLKESEL